MGSQEEDIVQFRCKLCQHTGASKAEIANHFLNEHVMVEYVSPKKKAEGSRKGAKNTSQQPEAELEEKTDVKKKTPRKRGRPKSKASSALNKSPASEIKQSEPAIDEEERLQQLGRGMRKKKKKTQFDEFGEEEDVNSDDDDDDVDDDDYEDDVINALMDDINEDSGDSDKNDVESGMEPKNDGGWICAGEENENKQSTTPRGRVRNRNSNKKSKADKRDEGGRSSAKQNLGLRVPTRVYAAITNDKLKEWERVFEEKNKMEMFQCSEARCSSAMGEAEFDVHRKCHVPHMEGFRCFICKFMCLHWRNMRHHYRKVHDQTLNTVLCDFEHCQKDFPRIASLRNHVLMTHIKPQIISLLSSDETDLSVFSKYMKKRKSKDKKGSDKVIGIDSEQTADLQNAEIRDEGIEEDDEVEVDDDDDHDHDYDDEEEYEPKKRGRGRPPKGKKPIGRPRKNPEVSPKVSTYSKRLHGDEREKFQRRLVAFICDVCHAKFNEEDKMTQHKTLHFQSDSEEIRCTECDMYVSTDDASLRLHMSEEHKNMLQLHRCDECKFSSNRYHDLKKHRIVHTGAKNYMCDKCGKCTTTPYNLKVHYRRMHATDEEKQIKCITCDYRCADKAILKDHVRQKHGLLINGDEYQNPRAVVFFPCHHCEYTGRKQSSLDYHMRIHTENRQFKCHFCTYASKTKNNLMLHIRTHDGLRPVKCPECDFRGATNKIISEHVMCKHAKSRPYECTICNWSTSYSGNMWKHVDAHQKELGDKMPEFPVTVTNAKGHAIPTPLRPPSGKKRGSGNKGSGFKLKLMKAGKKNARSSTTKISNLPSGISIMGGQHNIQTIQIPQGQPIENLPEGVSMMQVVNADGHMIVEQLPEDQTMGSNALSRLAAAVASAQEVHIIPGPQGIGRQGTGREQQIITTQINEPMSTSIHPTSIHLADNGVHHHDIAVEYSVPAAGQQIITTADLTQVITADHGYHAPPNPSHQQQHQQQQQEQLAGGSSIQQAAVHAGISTGGEAVPVAVVEQIVQDTQHQEDHAVQNLVASMIPHEAELVMSMMQIQQVPHVQRPNVSQ